MKVRFWGTRGSIATPGPETNHFGGNTSCVEVTTDSGAHLILDCGTGARRLAGNLLSRGEKPLKVNILLGHTHWDHIQGFPFFGPLFVPGSSVAIHGPESSSANCQPRSATTTWARVFTRSKACGSWRSI
jgi:phosphoribosyl 1,2-cyclic phosphodiesterase